MKYLLFVTALLFSACQNETTEQLATNIEQEGVVMQSATLYKVYEGDAIVKITDDARVKLTQNSQKNYTEAELLEGSAKIISH